MSATEIADRIEEAFRTLANLPEGQKHRRLKSLWPEVMQDSQDLWYNYARYDAVLPRIVPSPYEIKRMDEVFNEWLPILQVADKKKSRAYAKLIALKALGKSYAQCSFYLRRMGIDWSKSYCHQNHMACILSIQKAMN